MEARNSFWKNRCGWQHGGPRENGGAAAGDIVEVVDDDDIAHDDMKAMRLASVREKIMEVSNELHEICSLSMHLEVSPLSISSTWYGHSCHINSAMQVQHSPIVMILS